MTVTAGLDVGGAHLKVARLSGGQIEGVEQIACPLWQDTSALEAALRAARVLTDGASRYAITMTAELTEIFESREDGALRLIKLLSSALGPSCRFFAGLKGFTTAGEAAGDPMSIASANFLATARLIASRRPRSLLIDMGSTTTDIIPCDRPQGLSDAERLQTGELVYTGLTRTAVPSITTRAPLLGTWQGLARDAFASMADVRRILGELPADVDQHATADGRSTSVDDSLRRFARGFGRDADMRHLAGWRAAAAYVREEQVRSICDGAMQVLSRPGLDVSAGVVAAGTGAYVAESVARRLGLPCTDFGELAGADLEQRLWATRCAPAVAVAMLLDLD